MHKLNSVMEKHQVVIMAWCVVSLALAFIDPPLAAVLYLGLLAAIFKWWQGVLAVVLAASLLQCQALTLPPIYLPPPQTKAAPVQPDKEGEQPEIVGPCMCIVVLVVGTIVVYQLVKFCKAHLPPPRYNPPTNSVPPVTNSIPTNAFPAVFSDLPLPDAGPRSFTMNCTIAPDGSLALAPANAAYWSDDWGMTQQQWTNALPPLVPLDQLPYQVDYTNGVLSITEPGQAVRTVVLERSADMVNWQPIATNQWSARFTQVSEVDADAPEGGAFYRIQFPPGNKPNADAVPLVGTE